MGKWCGCNSWLDIDTLRINTWWEKQPIEETIHSFKDAINILTKLRWILEPEIYFKFILHKINSEEPTKINESWELYQIELEDWLYYIEVHNSDNIITQKSNRIRSLFWNFIHDIISVLAYEWKIYVIYR